jgi:dCMP deaminase
MSKEEQPTVNKRQAWDDYFMEITHKVAGRSTCLRRKVGCVLVQGKALRGTGYNGAPSGVDSCIDLGECLMRNGSCIRCIHAEMNLILQTDNREREAAILYTTDRPCWNCANAIANSGIIEVIYDNEYHSDKEIVDQLFASKDIIIRRHSLTQSS